MPEAVYVKRGDVLPITRAAAQLSGAVSQDTDGRAVAFVRDIAASATGEGYRVGVLDFLKTASIVIVAGGEVGWDA
ncbi:MAG: hypothetical protein IID33_17645, partial [Planctomycetes bacterium]|nr:hypothetical protein [Planctomycetota bacterium]